MADAQLTVVNDRAHGVTSLAPGQLELMLLRRTALKVGALAAWCLVSKEEFGCRSCELAIIEGRGGGGRP